MNLRFAGGAIEPPHRRANRAAVGGRGEDPDPRLRRRLLPIAWRRGVQCLGLSIVAQCHGKEARVAHHAAVQVLQAEKDLGNPTRRKALTGPASGDQKRLQSSIFAASGIHHERDPDG